MILKSVILIVSSLGGYCYIYIYQIFLLVCLLHIAPWLWLDHFERRGGAHPELKASNASWEKQASRRIVWRHLWFMALSTLELVADNPSASSVGGTSGTRLAFASAPGPGFGAWLVEARLAASPDIVRRGLFVLKRARVSNVPRRYNN